MRHEASGIVTIGLRAKMVESRSKLSFRLAEPDKEEDEEHGGEDEDNETIKTKQRSGWQQTKRHR